MNIKPIDAESSRRLWASYVEAHRKFAELEALEVVFERFTLVWPNSGSTDRA